MILPDDKLTLKIWEAKFGWVYAVYTGDGTLPGSLHSAGGGGSLDLAIKEGRADIERDIITRACEHEFEPFSTSNSIQICKRCRIADYSKKEDTNGIS